LFLLRHPESGHATLRTGRFAMIADSKTIDDWANRSTHHMAQADLFSAKYERAKARVKETPEYKKARDDVQRKIIDANWWMKDALAAYNFHIREANRLNQAIIAQHVLRQMTGEKL
jgi:hypothetical protein